MLHDPQSTPASAEFPITVIMERVPVRQGPWETERWQVVTVLPRGDNVAKQETTFQVIYSGHGRTQYRWDGLTITLYKDEVEGYYCNLRAQNPSIFVVCRQEEGEGVQPFLVTLCYDAIEAYIEVDELVFSTDIPPQIYHWVEHFVLDNYVLEPKKKRKRTQWNGDTERGQ